MAPRLTLQTFRPRILGGESELPVRGRDVLWQPLPDSHRRQSSGFLLSAREREKDEECGTYDL